MLLLHKHLKYLHLVWQANPTACVLAIIFICIVMLLHRKFDGPLFFDSKHDAWANAQERKDFLRAYGLEDNHSGTE